MKECSAKERKEHYGKHNHRIQLPHDYHKGAKEMDTMKMQASRHAAKG